MEAYTNTVKIVYPRYFEDFKCKASKCRHVCCHGWHISLSYNEYYRLLGLEAPPELRHLLDKALVIYDNPTPDRYAYMADDRSGDCMMFGKDGLCMLQKHCGEEAISSVCRLYPRAVHMGGCAEPVCTLSCEAVIERLIAAPDPIEFCLTDREVAAVPPDINMTPEQTSLRIECIKLIQSDSPISTKLNSLIALISGEESHKLMTITCGKGYLCAAYDLITELSDNASALAEYGRPALKHMSIDCKDSITDRTVVRFADLCKKIKTEIPLIEEYFGKIFANHMYYEQFPYLSETENVHDALTAFFAVFVLATFVSVCHYDMRPTQEAFVDSLAAVFRTVEHSAFYKNANIVLKADGDI